MTKPAIKENIAKLLMHSSVGLTENAVIQQVTATTNVNAITAALEEMSGIGDIILDRKRWKMTPIGRSMYADMSSAASHELPVPEDTAPENPAPQRVMAPLFERVSSIRTPDGQLHATQAAAEQHYMRQQLLPHIDQFILAIGSKKTQSGIIAHYIIKWEQYKKDPAYVAFANPTQEQSS